MKIGIVTVTYNSEHVLADFLSSLDQQDYNNVLTIFIDNASKDKTLNAIKSWKNTSKILIENKHNAGVASGNNQGIKLALANDCQFILLLNNDTVFEPQLLSKLINAHINYGSSLVVPKMNYFNPKDIIWYAGGFFNPSKGFLNYHRGQGVLDQNQYNQDDVVEYAPTCCVLIHKKVFEDVGLMDERYFVYFDDADFFYRVKHHSKHELRYIHRVKFFHKIGSLSKSRNDDKSHFYSPFFIHQNCKNHMYFLKKQRRMFTPLLLMYIWFYHTLRFFFSSNFEKKWKTLILIQTSLLEGLRMRL